MGEKERERLRDREEAGRLGARQTEGGGGT